jgi:hypothetical protein
VQLGLQTDLLYQIPQLQFNTDSSTQDNICYPTEPLLSELEVLPTVWSTTLQEFAFGALQDMFQQQPTAQLAHNQVAQHAQPQHAQFAQPHTPFQPPLELAQRQTAPTSLPTEPALIQRI